MSNNLLIHTNDTFTAKGGLAVRFEDIFEGISKEISRYRFKGGRHLSDQEIEDLRQEAFKKAIISIGSYDPQRSFGCPQAYGYTIALSCEKNAFRKTARRDSVFSSQDAESEGGEEFGSDREFESKEALSYIKSKIATLPKNQRKVLELSIMGVEPEKISQYLGCSQNAVYSRLCRARSALAEALGKTFLSEYGYGTKAKTYNNSRTGNSTAVIFLIRCQYLAKWTFTFAAQNKSSIFGIDMRDFAAIDFETANFESTSVCSVGVVIVRNGEIKDSFYSLIQPEPNYYNRFCTSIHGLCREDTEEAPVFPLVWKEVEKRIIISDEDAKKLGSPYLPLVAHNKAFDEGCLKAVFQCYQMDYPDYNFYDTLWASRQVMPDLENHQLQTVAAACGYYLENHHHALADAEACAIIAMKIL